MFNRNTWSVFIFEIRRTLTRKGFLFSAFALPVIAVALFYVVTRATGADDPAQKLQELQFDLQSVRVAGYVDESGIFPAPPEFAAEVTRSYPTVAAAESALDAGEIDVYFIIPADYLKSGLVQLYMPTFSLGMITDAPVRQLFYGEMMDQGVSVDLLTRLSTPAMVSAVELTRGGEDQAVNNEEQNIGIINVVALLLTFSLFSTNGYLMQSVIEEKDTRLIEILISSVRPTQLLTGKILALGLLGLLQVAAYVVALVVALSMATGSGTFLDGLNISAELWVVAFVYYVLGYLLYAAVFGAMGAITTDINESSGLMTVFALIVIAPYFFITQIAADPGGGLAVGLSLFPFTASLSMVMRATVGDVPLIQHLISVVLLVLTNFGMLWMAARLFRVQSLLSGKMPKLSQIPRMIFSGD